MLKKSCLLFLFILTINGVLYAQDTRYQYLSGRDKDHAVAWDFFINTGMKSGAWAKIPVPSNWEFQGFGTFNYYTDTKNPEETGQYRYKFNVDAGAKGKNVFIVFEGSMTETEVKLNGHLAGPVHIGGFYRFKYDVTQLLNLSGENVLEVSVKKQTFNASVNRAERRADFWQFGGIFRPVYLEMVPTTYMDHIAVDAKADGSLSLNVFPVNANGNNRITAVVRTLKGLQVGLPVSIKALAGAEMSTLNGRFANVKLWDPESPNLYDLVVTISNGNGIPIHRIKQRFGFRTAELRLKDGFYVNGKKVVFKGVCRHSEWPESGRTLSKDLNIKDINLMKEMNMNAVRMSHYPPDQDFLDACDSLGLFVLDELTGWQAKYDTVVGRKLVKELVVRDVNHPSIVIWDNGNEGGWNTALDGDYAKYDPQKRLVIHPWERFNGTDTKHYPDYNYVANSVLYGNDVFFPTEFMHGNYDGGSGAGLDDYWNLMRMHPYFAGGFLWSFADEAAARVDENGRMDTANDSAPDGVVGPHREKEANFYTIKEIWSPVFIANKAIAPTFDGRLIIENRYIYTNLNKCAFTWQLVKFPSAGNKSLAATVTASGKATSNLEPGEKGFLNLNLPTAWQQNDAIYLKATDANGKEIFTWSWPIRSPASLNSTRSVEQMSNDKLTFINADSLLTIKSANLTYNFNTKTGYIVNVLKGDQKISLSKGPVLAGAGLALTSFKYEQQGENVIVQSNFSGAKGWLNAKWIFYPGKPVKLEYQYSQKGEADFMGITFNYPEDQVTGMKWLGRGPYRVYKNRLKGQRFGVWHKDYNNTITGESWQYPEFKGYHSQLYWVKVESKEGEFTVYNDGDDLFLQMFKPAHSSHERASIQARFPDGDIGFLNSIAPIGTRFQQPELLGPQSQKNIQINYTPVSGSLWFDFR